MCSREGPEVPWFDGSGTSIGFPESFTFLAWKGFFTVKEWGYKTYLVCGGQVWKWLWKRYPLKVYSGFFEKLVLDSRISNSVSPSLNSLGKSLLILSWAASWAKVNTKNLARLVSMLRGFFAKLVSLRERGWLVPEGHCTGLHKVKPSPSREHFQGSPDKLKQSSLLHWPLCGTFYALGEIRLLHVICISYPQLLLEKFRL